MEKIHKRAKNIKPKVLILIDKAIELAKKHIAFIITISTVTIIFISLFIFSVLFYSDKAAPRTTVASTNIGGQNREQIKNTLRKLINNFHLSLTHNGKSVTANSSDLGIKINMDKITNDALTVGKNNPFTVFLSNEHFSLAGTYDKNKVKAFINNHFPELVTKPQNPQITFDKNQGVFTVQDGAIGQSVDMPQLYGKINEVLSDPKLAQYKIITTNDKPTITDADAEKVKNEINSVLTQGVSVFNNGRVIWRATPSTIASWINIFTKDKTSNKIIKLKPQPNNKTYDFNFNKNIIKKTVYGAVLDSIGDKPINQIGITNGKGEVLQVIKPGHAGSVPTNTEAVINKIHSDLSSGLGSSPTLLTAEGKIKTVGKVARDNRWIEYNLSTYTVTLHNGHNVVWSTNQTSKGKTSTPTITGLYSVFSKVPVQCMPNPPKKDPLCNIHYVTYWERSGYAFHEAWWMKYANGNVRQGISHGCVNMFQNDAKRVYDFASIGTPVWTHY